MAAAAGERKAISYGVMANGAKKIMASAVSISMANEENNGVNGSVISA
jgi:hypothetical protein